MSTSLEERCQCRLYIDLYGIWFANTACGLRKSIIASGRLRKKSSVLIGASHSRASSTLKLRVSQPSICTYSRAAPGFPPACKTD